MRFNHFLFFLILIPTTVFGKNANEQINKTNKEGSFNVCSYNIHFDQPNDSLGRWDRRRSMVLDLLSTSDIDMAGLQEVSPSQLADLKALGIFGTFGQGVNDGKVAVQNTILYRKSRFKLLESGIFWLSTTPSVSSRGWDAKNFRNCSWGKFKDKQTKKIFYFFTAHFDHIGVEARLQSAYLVWNKINEITHGAPAFFMGDLNSEERTEPIQYLNEKMDNARECSLTEPTGPYGTGHGFRINVKVRRIDYIYVSRNKVSVQEYHTLDQLYKGKAPSDHWPVCIKAKIK